MELLETKLQRAQDFSFFLNRMYQEVIMLHTRGLHTETGRLDTFLTTSNLLFCQKPFSRCMFYKVIGRYIDKIVKYLK